MEIPVYKAGGHLDSDSPVYVRRRADNYLTRWCGARNQPHLAVIAPRQQGKTSLIYQLQTVLPTNHTLIIISLEGLPRDGVDEWYSALGSRLKEEVARIEGWTLTGSGTRQEGWRSLLREVVRLMSPTKERLVLVLDEIGSLVRSAWSEDFFCLLREIMEARGLEPIRFILLGAANPSELITQSNISPFNVAEDIRLEDFSREQVIELGRHLNLPPTEHKAVADRIYYWASGQPYITQWFYLELSRQTEPIVETAVDRLVEEFCRNNTSHLPGIISRLQEDPKLLEYALKYREQDARYLGTFNPRQFFLTRILGLTREEDGRCRIRNRIYQRALESLETEPDPRELIFMSYSHKDDDVVISEFKMIFEPYAQKLRKTAWFDIDRIHDGSFEPVIRAAMEKAVVAILFVSPAYLTAKFVQEVELPTLLADSDAGRVKLAWVAVDHSGYRLTPLRGLHCLNEPQHPVRSFNGADRTRAWNEIARKIFDLGQ